MPPVRLTPTAHEKVWGSTQTEPWFRDGENKRVGEVWFTGTAPILVKFLFTSDKLSVQVHPDDSYARKHHNCDGKTEMWHILRAGPEAKIGLGLNRPLTRTELREACESGAIVDKLNWIPVRPGDTFFTPAGTIHAIGSDLALCEIQQISDITYRLFDYNRPRRELHLDRGIEVWSLLSRDPRTQGDTHREARDGVRKSSGQSREVIAQCDYFRTERLVVTGTELCPRCTRDTLYIAIEGEGTIDGLPFRAGEVWEFKANSSAFEVSSPSALFLITAKPEPR